ncbi:sensor domain-containing protein [Mycobacteroides abscessus]|uniref:sensor domain-containing protein n=1 Tax=Mycobacteroides abscessus TaxID=36809 RepID=UPI001877CFF6|nr:hypothetical protein [Mycobacteroides abscessus]
MNPQGHGQPGGREQRPWPGGNPNRDQAPFDQQETQQAQTFSRPQQPPPPYPQAPQGYPTPPQYASPPPPPGAPHASSAPQPSPEPPSTSWIQQLQQRQWWIAGGVVVIAAALVAYVMLTGDTSTNEDTATSPSTSVAQVPAGRPPRFRPSPAPRPPHQPAAPSGTPAPPPPPAPTGPTLAPDALAPLLLPGAEIDKQLNIAGAAPVGPVESQPLGGDVQPPHCTGAWGPGYRATYDGTGFTGMAIGVLAQGQAHRIAQSVLAFPDPAAAQRIYDKLIGDWNACQNTHAVFSFQGASTEIDIKTPRPIGDINTLMLVPTTSPVPGQQCERGMALRGNVIVDVRVCSPTVGSAGYSITRAIADKVR